MRPLCATLALLVAAANAAAYDQAINYTLSLDAATGNTRVDYVITSNSSYSWTLTSGQPMYAGGHLAGWSALDASVAPSLSVPTAGTPGWSGTLSGPREILAASVSLTATNVDTGATRNLAGFMLASFSFGGNTYNSLGLSFGPSPLPMVDGEHVRITGDTSGSFVIAKSFSFFNQGQWISSAYSNVIIGSAPAVPEPSTYGLALGGLALVGVAIRRRRSE